MPKLSRSPERGLSELPHKLEARTAISHPFGVSVKRVTIVAGIAFLAACADLDALVRDVLLPNPDK